MVRSTSPVIEIYQVGSVCKCYFQINGGIFFFNLGSQSGSTIMEFSQYLILKLAAVQVFFGTSFIQGGKCWLVGGLPAAMRAGRQMPRKAVHLLAPSALAAINFENLNSFLIS